MAGGDDSWEMHVDGDHSGDQMRFGTADIENEEERALAQGRWSQSYHTRFPNLGPDGQESWSWFWMTQAQWHDELPYADHGFRLDGEIGGGEATAFIEVRRQAWDDFLFNDPEGSVIHDYNEGDITGLGWAVFRQRCSRCRRRSWPGCRALRPVVPFGCHRRVENHGFGHGFPAGTR